LQNTVRQALLLPTSREAKYKANAAIDTFCVRLGDVLQAAVIFVGSTLHFDVRAFAAVSLVMTVAWIFVAFRLYQQPEHSSRTPQIRNSLDHPAVLPGAASPVPEGPVQ
jgi:ATP:ADP antiporter, AAA family